VGFYGEFGYGYRFHRNFALQSEIGYLHSGVKDGNDIHGVPISLSAKGVYPIKDFELFIGAGLGIYLTQYKGELNNVQVDDRDNVLGGHLFIGADYNIASNIFIGVEGKYIFTEKAEYNGQKVNLDGLATVIRLGFRF
jgi:opacity protein-like surface antigen